MKQKLRFLMLTLLCAVFSTAWGQADYSTDYEGNITLSTTSGTNASECSVKIGENTYAGIKAGTSSKVGAVQITVPSGTQYLHLHVAGWNSESGASLTVTPTGYSNAITLTPNSGITGNTPFVFNGDASSPNYYKVIEFSRPLQENTTLTFKATNGYRFVIFGVTYEKKSVSPTLAAPKFTPAEGTYNEAQNVTITTTATNADIYYTTDESTPTAFNGTKYTTAINISETTTIKAVTFKDGIYSDVVTATYIISIPVPVPTFSPEGGRFTEAQMVSISATDDAAIFYTTDESTPTTSSTEYTEPISVTSTTTIKAIAVKNGVSSDVASATYTIATPSSGYDIDFESEASSYSDWTFTNIVSNYINDNAEPHGGLKYGSTGGKASGSIQTNEPIATPKSLTCYVSKQSTNTTTSTWKIQVSSDGSSWTDVKSTSATDMTMGKWKEFSADLSSYTDVYVRIYYSGTTAVRLIDDLTLDATPSDKYYVAGSWTNWVNNMKEMKKKSDGTYILEDQDVNATNVGEDHPKEFKIIKIPAGETTKIWYGGPNEGDYWGINENTHENITLNKNGGPNFKLEYYGTWTFTVDPTGDTPKLTVDGDWQPSYYLVGDFNLNSNNEWAVGSSYKLNEQDGKYSISKTIAQGQRFKFIKMIGSEITTWYGAVSNGDFDFLEDYVGDELSLTSPGENFLMKLSNLNNWNIVFDPDNMKVVLSNYTADIATLPFVFTSGKSDIASTPGLNHSGLGSDYSSTAKLRFDDEGDYLILHFNGRPGILTYDIKGNPGSGNSINGKFVVQKSEDGITYSDLKEYTSLGNTVLSEEFDNLGENVRYIKWLYRERTSGNVGLGNIKLDKYPFIFTINPLATDGESYYATIADLGEGYYKVTDDVDVKTVVINEDGKLDYTVFSKDDIIPGNAAYLVVASAAGEYSFPATSAPENEVTLGENMLISTGEGNVTADNMLAAAKAANPNHEGDFKFYKLSLNGNNEEGSVGFYWGKEGGVAFNYTKGHQAFLAVPQTGKTTTAAYYLFDGTTGIYNVMATESESNNATYTLSGIRVDNKQLPKGIYIKNGKKVVVR